MTLEQIDAALAAWNGRLAAIAENLMELEQQGAYRVLAGAGGCERVVTTGVTRARVEPGLAAMPGVLANFGRINEVVERAKALRQELPSLFHGEARQRELERLLWGASVPMPAAEVPLERRSLLSGAELPYALTLEQVLQPMVAAFAAVRDAVGLVARAWEELGERLDRAEADARGLEGDLAACGADGLAALNALRGQMLSVRGRSKADPLGALAELTKSLEPALVGLHRRVERLRALRRGLEAASGRLAEIERLHEAALTACAEASLRIVSDQIGQSVGRPAEMQRLQGLRVWLERLTGHCAETTVEAVEVGLHRWRTVAETCASEAVKAQGAAQSALGERRELRGRLEALKAKARAYGRSEQTRMASMVSEAEGLLQARPTDLVRARGLVRAYEAELSRCGELERVSG